MKLEGAFEVAAPASRLWEFFWDAEGLGSCLPGCQEVQRLDDSTFSGTVKARVGPVQALFVGKASIVDSTRPSHIVLKAEGRDSRTSSQVRATIDLVLSSPDEGHARATYQADVTIVGRLGQFGDGIVRETAAVLLEEFAKNVSSYLQDRDNPAATTAELNMVSVTGKVIWRRLKGSLRT